MLIKDNNEKLKKIKKIAADNGSKIVCISKSGRIVVNDGAIIKFNNFLIYENGTYLYSFNNQISNNFKEKMTNKPLFFFSEKYASFFCDDGTMIFQKFKNIDHDNDKAEFDLVFVLFSDKVANFITYSTNAASQVVSIEFGPQKTREALTLFGICISAFDKKAVDSFNDFRKNAIENGLPGDCSMTKNDSKKGGEV